MIAFYLCYKCKKPYFGGLKVSEEAGVYYDDNYKKEDLVCGSCIYKEQGNIEKSKCKKHGIKYITWKCRFCCNVSAWFCWGNTHFCYQCHQKQEQGVYLNRKLNLIKMLNICYTVLCGVLKKNEGMILILVLFLIQLLFIFYNFIFLNVR